MKTFTRITVLGILVLSLFSALPVLAKVNVVASVPDLGDMARRIGGERVEVVVLASGREDLHGVPARPSFIPKLHKADLLLTLGLDAEHSWLPALVDEARNSRIREDNEGWIEVYEGIEVLDIPTVISRSEGEQHPQGNPHINVSPQNGSTMAENIAYALMEFDPEGSPLYEKNLAEYLAQLNEATEQIRSQSESLAGTKVISYHADVSYLLHFYGMESVGTLEPKPGIEPSARHLAKLADKAKKEGVQLVIYNQAQPGKLPEKFAKRIGAQAVQMGNMVGSMKGIDTWVELQEFNLKALLDGLGATHE